VNGQLTNQPGLHPTRKVAGSWLGGIATIIVLHIVTVLWPELGLTEAQAGAVVGVLMGAVGWAVRDRAELASDRNQDH